MHAAQRRERAGSKMCVREVWLRVHGDGSVHIRHCRGAHRKTHHHPCHPQRAALLCALFVEDAGGAAHCGGRVAHSVEGAGGGDEVGVLDSDLSILAGHDGDLGADARQVGEDEAGERHPALPAGEAARTGGEARHAASGDVVLDVSVVVVVVVAGQVRRGVGTLGGEGGVDHGLKQLGSLEKWAAGLLAAEMGTLCLPSLGIVAPARALCVLYGKRCLDAFNQKFKETPDSHMRWCCEREALGAACFVDT